jgi:hypothetical protein
VVARTPIASEEWERSRVYPSARLETPNILSSRYVVKQANPYPYEE